MELFIIVGVGVAVVGYYLTRGSPLAMSSNPFQTAPMNIGRSMGAVPGSVTPGSTLPGSSAEGPGPNTGAAIVGTAGTAGAGLVALAAMPAGITALGAATLGIGVVIGVGLALWIAHAARVKGAKDENGVLNELVPNFSKCLIAEFNALNTGQVTPATAMQDLEGIRTTYWTAIAPYQKGPGQHTHPCAPLRQSDVLNTGEYAPGCIPWVAGGKQTTACDKTCTAGCCIGCDYIEPAICASKWLLQQPTGGTIKVHSVGASKYGYTGQAGFALTYNPRG